MLWTEEAVEALRQLALEGRSATVIAAAIGAASRNAVIGKANRIGIKLGGGGQASDRTGSAAVERPRPQLRAPSRPAIVARRQSPPPALPRVRAKRRAWIFADAKVGEMLRVGLENVEEANCRWPVGDPIDADFAYCGLQTAEGHSYCAGHCRMAYRPPASAPREAPREWGWRRDRMGYQRLP